MWCGGVNAHSTLWDNDNDYGMVIEEIMQIRNVVNLTNEGNTRFNIRTRTDNMTLASHASAGVCSWAS